METQPIGPFQALWLDHAVNEGSIAGSLIGQTSFTLQTYTEASLTPGIMVQVYTD